jgi:hypothetical protein
MNPIHAYAWAFATLLFILAIQLIPGNATGNISLVGASTQGENNPIAWMGIFVVIALAGGIIYARYHHFLHPHPDKE